MDASREHATQLSGTFCTQIAFARKCDRIREVAVMSIRVNGELCEIDGDVQTPLIFVMRNEWNLTGPKLGCGAEQCGACAVLCDGASTLTCVTPASAFVGREITTVEAIATTPLGQRIAASFALERAGQCGYCIPGIVTAAYALLLDNARPSRDDFCRALEPHLCRCGSHAAILRALQRVADDSTADSPAMGTL